MKKLIFQIIISSIIVSESTCLLYGQDKTIHGKVTTFDSIPLIGASIKVKSTKEVVQSDTLGMFTAICFPNDKLKVTARGFLGQNVKVDVKIKYIFVNLRLKQGPKNRDLAIGYGHVADKDNLYSVSSLIENDMDFSQYSNIYEIVEGRFSGVQVNGSEIIIRGSQTFLGSDAALLVVNGMVVNEGFFGSLPTTEIASINVLKGPAASIYGSRGANGVVIVETKGVRNQ